MVDYAPHFDDLYRKSGDPWDYATSAYERCKYDATLAALTRPRYANAVEAGCSIGVLSARLATRCDRLLALDFAAFAVERASERLAVFTGAEARRATLPEDWSDGHYDLIVLSEILYYLMPDAIIRMAELIARDATETGECVLVHWRGGTDTHVTPTDARDLFCTTLAALRPLDIAAHETGGAYDHRTIMFGSDRSREVVGSLRGMPGSRRL